LPFSFRLTSLASDFTMSVRLDNPVISIPSARLPLDSEVHELAKSCVFRSFILALLRWAGHLFIC
jgi:hypothetical protein